MSNIPHVQSAGGVIVNADKVLVISSLIRNTTGLPKGHVDEGESLSETAVREVKEETGYDTTIKKQLGTYNYEFDSMDGNRYAKTVTYFLMELANTNDPVQNLQPGEDFEVKWLTPHEALSALSYDDSKDAVSRVFSIS